MEVADLLCREFVRTEAYRDVLVDRDPTQDDAEVVNAVLDRVRAKMLWRVGLEDLLVLRPSQGNEFGSAKTA